MEVDKSRLMPIPYAVKVLAEAVSLAQKAGVYSLNDAATINTALVSLRERLELNANYEVRKDSQPLQQLVASYEKPSEYHVEESSK